MVIGGAPVEAASGERYGSENPYVGSPWASVLDAGTIWINAYRVVSPSVPFGGFGWSGLGRENGAAARRRVPREQVGLGRAERRHPGPVHTWLTDRRSRLG
jgi:hypothetical protein